MCCKLYHIIFSTFSLKFKCKICVQKEVIHNFTNHILVSWPAANLLILRKSSGFEKLNHRFLFKIWPTYRFSKEKSYNFDFHKNNVTWPLSANDLLSRTQGFRSTLGNCNGNQFRIKKSIFKTVFTLKINDQKEWRFDRPMVIFKFSCVKN